MMGYLLMVVRVVWVVWVVWLVLVVGRVLLSIRLQIWRRKMHVCLHVFRVAVLSVVVVRFPAPIPTLPPLRLSPSFFLGPRLCIAPACIGKGGVPAV